MVDSYLSIAVLTTCCYMDPKVLRLNILIDCSQPGGSWATNGPPPVCWWSKCNSDDTVVILLWGRASQVSKEPQAVELHPIGDWHTAGDTPDCLAFSAVILS